MSYPKLQPVPAFLKVALWTEAGNLLIVRDFGGWSEGAGENNLGGHSHYSYFLGVK